MSELYKPSAALMNDGITSDVKVIEKCSVVDGANGEANDEFFSLWVLIAQTKDALLAARQREYNRFHIKNERRAVLFCIQMYGGQATPSEIARFLLRRINSVSEMLKRMEKQGLVKKQKSPGKPKVMVKLTEKGHEVFNQSLYNTMDRRILSVLTKKQRERLRAYLFAIRKQALRDLGIPEWSAPFPPEPAQGIGGANPEH